MEDVESENSASTEDQDKTEIKDKNNEAAEPVGEAVHDKEE